jgi:hypothetical protein
MYTEVYAGFIMLKKITNIVAITVLTLIFINVLAILLNFNILMYIQCMFSYSDICANTDFYLKYL